MADREAETPEPTRLADPPTLLESPPPVPVETLTPAPAAPPSDPTLPPFPGGKPPQSGAAEIRPTERRPELTRLSQLLGFQVIALDGTLLGRAADYIINTCETYLIYLVLEASSETAFPPGARLAVPYELLTINSGVLDAENRGLYVYLFPDALAGAPLQDPAAPLVPPDWEGGVRAFWQDKIRISNLTTACNAGGTIVHKDAYATQLLEAPLKDGLGNQLGRVEEAVLSPESGKLAFFVVDRVDGQGLALVPLAAVNIPREALQPGGEISLVLLTENSLLAGAPQLASIEQAIEPSAQGQARQHWGR
jgi:sporulation protein YlmC with PRC-barrel domain